MGIELKLENEIKKYNINKIKLKLIIKRNI